MVQKNDLLSMLSPFGWCSDTGGQLFFGFLKMLKALCGDLNCAFECTYQLESFMQFLYYFLVLFFFLTCDLEQLQSALFGAKKSVVGQSSIPYCVAAEACFSVLQRISHVFNATWFSYGLNCMAQIEPSYRSFFTELLFYSNVEIASLEGFVRTPGYLL